MNVNLAEPIAASLARRGTSDWCAWTCAQCAPTNRPKQSTACIRINDIEFIVRIFAIFVGNDRCSVVKQQVQVGQHDIKKMINQIKL